MSYALKMVLSCHSCTFHNTSPISNKATCIGFYYHMGGIFLKKAILWKMRKFSTTWNFNIYSMMFLFSRRSSLWEEIRCGASPHWDTTPVIRIAPGWRHWYSYDVSVKAFTMRGDQVWSVPSLRYYSSNQDRSRLRALIFLLFLLKAWTIGVDQVWSVPSLRYYSSNQDRSRLRALIFVWCFYWRRSPWEVIRCGASPRWDTTPVIRIAPGSCPPTWRKRCIVFRRKLLQPGPKSRISSCGNVPAQTRFGRTKPRKRGPRRSWWKSAGKWEELIRWLASCTVNHEYSKHLLIISLPPVKPEGTIGLHSVSLSVSQSVRLSVCLSVCLSVTLVFRTFLNYAFTYLVPHRWNRRGL